MNDLVRALATSAGILFPIIVLTVIVSMTAVRRGEANLHGGHEVPVEVVTATAAKSTAAAAAVDEINVGQILIYGVVLFTVTMMILFGLSLLQHM